MKKLWIGVLGLVLAGNASAAIPNYYIGNAFNDNPMDSFYKGRQQRQEYELRQIQLERLRLENERVQLENKQLNQQSETDNRFPLISAEERKKKEAKDNAVKLCHSKYKSWDEFKNCTASIE